jgi:hypothetical protein
MNYQSLVETSLKTSVYLSEIANLANLNHNPVEESESGVQSFFVDNELEKKLGLWDSAEVFVYKDKVFLAREFTTDGEDVFCEETEVLDEKVWLEVIELILEEVRKEALYKLLNYI